MNPALTIDGACRLGDRGVIRARGADAATFLQGQLTNDVLRLPEARARLAGFCSAKGRLQATFTVWREGTEDFLLVCPQSVLAPTLKRLSMFVLRAKCKLSDAGAEVVLWGVAGPSAVAEIAGLEVWGVRSRSDGIVVRLPDVEGVARAMIALPGGDDAGLAALPPIALDDWRWLDVRSGIVAIEAATVDRFVPQMVNYEIVGGVDFQKGCYPGQEVVARSQYRGTTKRRTFLFDCDELPTAGADVFAGSDAGAEPAGTVVNAAPAPGGTGASALVEIRLAAVGDSDAALHLNAADGPALRRADLPYPVAVEAESAA